MAEQPKTRMTAAPDAGSPDAFDVFLSYTRRDAVPVAGIAVDLKREGLTPWLDRWCLTPGGSWQDEMAAGLAASRACAVFIGPGDIGPWERQELELAVDHAARRGSFRLFPVLLPGVDPLADGTLPPFLRSRTWVDLRSGTSSANGLQELVRAIRGLPYGPDTPIEPRHDVSPYRGLWVFEEQHAPFFFGREADVQQLLERLRTGRFVAIVGASGSGKSSLARAGLVPALRSGALPGSGDWPLTVIRPGAHPLETLAAAAAALGDSRGLANVLTDLRHDERGLHLSLQFALADRPQEQRAVIVIDQLEEAFTLCEDADERARAFDNLVYAASRPGGRSVVALTIRADFYPRLAEHRELAQMVERHQELVGAMGPVALRQAIEGPAQRAGLTLEPGLTDAILDDVGEDPGALPLLEHALLETWRRREAGLLTLDGYVRSGGVHKALAARADEVFGSLGDAQGVARRLLLRLAQPGEGVEDTRRRAPLSELLGASAGADATTVQEIIDRFTEARLLTSARDAHGRPSVELAHEALIRGWPLLRAWIDDGRVGLVLQRRLIESADDWNLHERDEDRLFRGSRLADTATWSRQPDVWLTGLEHEFLEASLARERRARGARRRRLIGALIAFAVALVTISAVAVIALDQRRDALSSKAIASSRALAAASNAELTTDPTLSLTLALGAWARSRTPEANVALREATAASDQQLGRLEVDSRTAYTAAFSPDGTLLVTGGYDGLVKVWDVARRQPVAQVARSETSLMTARFSRDGTRIALGFDNGRLLVTDRALRTFQPVLEAEGPIVDVAFDSTGTRLAAAAGELVEVLSLDGRHSEHTLRGHSGGVWSVDFSSDGHRVVSGGFADSSVLLWDADSGSEVGRMRASGTTVTARLSPDGERILGAATDVRVWRASDGTLLRTASSGGRPLYTAAFSGDGTRIAAAGDDGAVRIWSAAGGPPLVVLRGHLAKVRSVDFGPRADRIVSASEDATARIWHAGPAVAWDAEDTEAVVFAPDGRTVTGGSSDGTTRIWDAASGRLKDELPGADGWTAAEFSPDGDQVLVSSLAAGTAQLWSPERDRARVFVKVKPWELNGARFDRTGRRVVYIGGAGADVVLRPLDGGREVSFSGVEDSMNDARLSPTGGVMAAAGSSGTIAVWRVDRPDRPRLLPGHTGEVTTFAFNPRGDRIATAGADRTLRVWDVRSGASRVLDRHVQDVTSAMFSPDGRSILSASKDGTVRLWDVGGRLPSVVHEAREGSVLDAAFSADGRLIATTGYDGTVRIAPCAVCARIDAIAATARSRPARELTPEEQRRYAALEP